MKTRLRNLSLLCVTLTICLAVLGVGYANWSDHLDVSGTAKVATFAVGFFQQETNDPLDHWFDGDNVPPIQGADETITDGFLGDPWRLDKDVGMTDCDLYDEDGDGYNEVVVFTIVDAYPCYFGKLDLITRNYGSTYVSIDRLRCEYLDEYGNSLEGGMYDWTSPDWENAHTPPIPPYPHPPGYELTWSNGISEPPIILAPAGSMHDSDTLSVWVHVLQLDDDPATPDEDESNQNETYRFRLTFEVSGPTAYP